MSEKIEMLSPCSERWNNMQEFNGGKFCQVCQKNVHDLTKKSSKEIRKLLKENDYNICGRITQYQIEKVNHFKEDKFSINVKAKKIISALSLFLVSYITIPQKKVFANRRDFKTQILKKEIEEKSINSSDTSLRNIKLSVVDEKGEPLIGAIITIIPTNRGFGTDIDGIAEIKLTPKDSILTISLTGYITKHIETNKILQDLTVTMIEDSTLLSEIVILGYMLAKPRKPLALSKKTPFFLKVLLFPYYQSRKLFYKLF